jgi:hypothetical protein
MHAVLKCMCVSHLQAPQIPTVHESDSPDRDRRRKTRSRDGQITHSTEVTSMPDVSQQDVPVGVNVSTAEDVSMIVET